MQFDRRSGVPKKLTVGRNRRRFSAKVFATFGGKAPIKMAAQKSDIDICGKLEGIGQGIYIAVKKEGAF